MCWYFSKLLNIFEIEWNRFPTGFICQPAEYVFVRVCVCESFPVIQSENKWSQFRARLVPQTRAETNPQSSKWRKCGFGYGFSLFSARQPHNPPSPPPKSLKACLCFSLCVCVCVFVVVFFLWKFPKTFRRHFVYFTSRRFSAVSLCLCGTNRGEEERERKPSTEKRDKSLSWIPFGLPPSLRFLLSGFHSQLMFFACSWPASCCCCCSCCCICLLFILSLLLAISFKWCQSFFTCFAQVRWAYPALCRCVCANLW